MAAGVSVIICCYNSALRLPETLRYLSLQKVNPSTAWEIIVVDNASTDNTAEVARKVWSDFSMSIKLTVVHESKPGLSNARVAGIAAANYSIGLFCDDDNWLDENYVQKAAEIFLADDTVAITGGWCEGKFEITPQPWLLPFYATLSIVKYNNTSELISHPVVGAGMGFRVKDFNDLMNSGFEWLLSGRSGSKLVSGDDSELCLAILLRGRKIYFSTELFFYHYMPAFRLTKAYINRLVLGETHHNNVIALYQYILKTEHPSFAAFYWKNISTNLKALAFFAARFLLKENRYYSAVSFRHHIKLLRAAIGRRDHLKSSYQRILPQKRVTL